MLTSERKAPLEAPFCFLGQRFWALLGLLSALWGIGIPLAAATECQAAKANDHGIVAQIFDGDTLRLSDGRIIRLVGINTPELGRDKKPPEALAQQARKLLNRLAPAGTRLGLRFDHERQDRYQRTLAHLQRTNGSNIQEQILAAGLATTLVVPPNNLNIGCYRRAEARARSQRLGIWALPRYQPRTVDSLESNDLGYRIVTGRISRIGHSRRSLWLELGSRFALRIARTDLPYFKHYRPETLLKQRVEARGWVHRRKGQLRMRIRHPAALEVEAKHPLQSTP